MRRLLVLSLLLFACTPSGQGGSGGPDLDQGVAGDDGIRPIDPLDMAKLPDMVDMADAAEPDAVVDAMVPDAEIIEGTRVGVATFNVQRFFDMDCDSGRCGQGDFERQLDRRDFELKAEDLARALVILREEHGADVVMLQEIEKEVCLQRVQFYLRQLGDPFPNIAFGETDFAGSLDVAVMSRGQQVRVETHRENAIFRPDGSRTRFSRELLEVHLDIDDERVIAFSAHYKSKNGDDPGRRIAEARATREIMQDVARGNPHALVVLGGDLNDTPGSRALDDLERDGDLARVAAELGDDAATYTYFDQRTALDHIYQATEAGAEYLPGSAIVVRSRGQDGLARSDHAALAARFVFRAE